MRQDWSFSALIAAYLTWLGQVNYAAATVNAAGKVLRLFQNWCAQRGLYEPREVTADAALSYQRWLYNYRKKNGKPLSVASQLQRLTLVTGFFRWLHRKNLILFNPMDGLTMPRRAKSLPHQVLGRPEIEAIINTPDVTTLQGIRDRTILELLYSSGLRRAEMAALRLHDLDLDAGMLDVVRGKGSKSRRIPIGQRAVAWLDKYLLEVRPLYATNDKEDHVFLSRDGIALNGDVLGHVVRKVVRASGVAVHGSCHLFRHSMATHMLDGGADIRYIQAMLGHAHLGSTQIYTQVSIQRLKEVHARTHPARLEHIREPRDKPR